MNWKALIAELNAAGLTQGEIAKACNCSQSSVSELLRGKIKEPGHSLGEALIALRSRHVPPVAA